MKHDYIEEFQIIDRFLMGKLSSEESEDFQDHTMTCQRCLDDLAMAERMQRGMVRVYQSDVIHTWTALGHLLAWWQRRGALSRYALAMAAVFTIVGPSMFLMWRMQHLQNQLDSTQATLAEFEQPFGVDGTQGNIPLFRLSPQRGISHSQVPNFTIRLEDSIGWIVLILEVDAEATGALQATLHDADGKEIWTTQNLLIDANGEITIGLQASTLKAGNYSLDIMQQGSRITNFTFRVVAMP